MNLLNEYEYEDEDEDEDDMCNICKNKIKNKIQTSCGFKHEFCFSCMLNWIEVSDKISCPICRGGLNCIVIGNTWYLNFNYPGENCKYKFKDLEHFFIVKKYINNILGIKECNSIITFSQLKTYLLNKNIVEILYCMSHCSEFKRDINITTFFSWKLPERNCDLKRYYIDD